MLSKKARLCVKVLAVIASAPPGKTVATHVLSQRLNHSVTYLESIARVLREAGLVTSFRGPGGGYAMACDPATLSVWEVVRLVDEPVQDEQDLPSKASPIQSLEVAIRATYIDFLSSRTIGDIAGSTGPAASFPVRAAPGFRLRPMPGRSRPVAPSSVFDLSSYIR